MASETTETVTTDYSPLQLSQHVSVLLQHQLRRGCTAREEAVPGEQSRLGLGVLSHLGGLGGAGQGQEGVETRGQVVPVVVGGLGGREGDPALQGGADGPQERGVGARHVGERRDRGHPLRWSAWSRERTFVINCNNYV